MFDCRLLLELERRQSSQIMDEGEMDDFHHCSTPDNLNLRKKTKHLSYQGREFNVIAYYLLNGPPSLRPSENMGLLESVYEVSTSSVVFLSLLTVCGTEIPLHGVIGSEGQTRPNTPTLMRLQFT